jgi:hypothetical protein
MAEQCRASDANYTEVGRDSISQDVKNTKNGASMTTRLVLDGDRKSGLGSP